MNSFANQKALKWVNAIVKEATLRVSQNDNTSLKILKIPKST